MPSSIMRKFLDEQNDSRQLTSEERNQINEELEIYLQELSYSYLLKFYKTKLGVPRRDHRSSKILIRKLIESLGSQDIVWTVQDLKDIMHRVQIERSIKKPRAVNIVRINTEDLNLEELKTQIEENLYSIEDPNSLPGFEITASPSNGTNGSGGGYTELGFRYWYLKTKKILTEAFDIQEISYRMYIPIKIMKIQHNNSVQALVYIYSKSAADVELAKKVLRETFEINFIDTGLKNLPPTVANGRFNDFLLELDQKIKQGVSISNNSNNSSVPPIWIDDVIISTKLAHGLLRDKNGQIIKDSRGQPIDLYTNSKRISVKGRGADLYSYPVVRKYMDDNGKVIGVRGQFEYIEHEYKFSAGYTEGLKTVNHVKFSVKPKGKVPPSTQELQMVREMLRELVEKYFVFA